MKQLKEPKATEREVKKTARVTSAEKVKTESIGELSTYLLKLPTNILYCSYNACKIISFDFISWQD